MARPRKKCVAFVLLLLAVYVVFSLISLQLNGDEIVKLPDKVKAQEDAHSGLSHVLYLTRPIADRHAKYGLKDQRETDVFLDVEGHNKLSANGLSLGKAANTNVSHRTLQEHKHKFLFVFRYYEQLGRATSNLIDLASLAKYNNRFLVVPYVNNSRMCGLAGGVSHHYRKVERRNQRKYASMDEYFNVQYLNLKLYSRGYSTLRHFRDLESHCENRFNIVLHFLFQDETFKKDTALWYRVSEDEVKALYKQVKVHDGWVDCPGIKRSSLSKQIDFKVNRYICVDPEIIRSARELEDKVLKGARCVAIVQWRGNGDERVHFPLDSSISQALRPSDFEFNAQLVKIARDFVANTFKGKFIGVHVRSERHVERKGINVTTRCFEKLATRVRESQQAIQVTEVFLASDLTDYGSDTLRNFAGANERGSLSQLLMKFLNRPATFNPKGILYDTGAIAIVEMNILSMATRVITLGGGNFQEWALALFLKSHNNESKRVHRMCELI